MKENREARLTRLVEMYQGMLLRLCYVYLKEMQLAQDAVQDTFLQAYRALDGFRGECSEKTWLIRIAVNRCRSMQRSAWLRHVDRRITPEELPVSADMPCTEVALDVMCSIMRLPPKLKEVVLLYYWQGMTLEEIAQSLGLSHSSVAGRLKRAREILRPMLEGGELDG